MFSSDAIQSGHINTSGILFLTTHIKLKAKMVHRLQELSDPSHPLADLQTRKASQKVLFCLLRDKHTFHLPPVRHWIILNLCGSSGSFLRFPKDKHGSFITGTNIKS